MAFAVVLLVTVDGVPSVYYGGEQASRGVEAEALNGDGGVHPVLPATLPGPAPQGA